MKLNQLFEVKYGNDIILSQRNLTSLPTDLPDRVSGYFYCYDNNLTSLEHCPSQVGGDFGCSSNRLTSLDGCPSQAGGNFWCHENKLTSLHNVHKHISNIGGNFVCKNNLIKSHILGLMMVEIGGEIITRLGNGTDVDEILNKWKNQGHKGVLGAQRELLDLGYDQLAQS